MGMVNGTSLVYFHHIIAILQIMVRMARVEIKAEDRLAVFTTQRRL